MAKRRQNLPILVKQTASKLDSSYTFEVTKVNHGKEPQAYLTYTERSKVLEGFLLKLLHESRKSEFTITYTPNTSYILVSKKTQEKDENTGEDVIVEEKPKKLDIIKISNDESTGKVKVISSCNCHEYVTGRKGHCVHTVLVTDILNSKQVRVKYQNPEDQEPPLPPQGGHMDCSAVPHGTLQGASFLGLLCEYVSSLKYYFYYNSSTGSIKSRDLIDSENSLHINNFGLSYDSASNHLSISDIDLLKSSIKDKNFSNYFSPSFVAYIVSNLDSVHILEHRKKIDDFLSAHPDFDFSRFNESAMRLYPFQAEGVRHLVRCGRGIVADQMGLGKTPTAIGACESIAKIFGKKIKALIVTLASTKEQWGKEIKKFSSRNAIVSMREKDLKAFMSAGYCEDVNYFVTNYESIEKHFNLIKEIKFDILVLDEVQKLKSSATIAWNNVYNLRIPYLFALSGTLLENNFDDLYSVMKIIDMNVLGPQWEFDWNYKIVNRYGDRPRGYKNISNLRDRVKPYIIRRRVADVLSGAFPEMKENKIFVDMSSHQIRRHDFHLNLAREIAAKLSNGRMYDSKNNAVSLLANFLRCRQSANDIRLLYKEEQRTGKIMESEPPKFDALKIIIQDKCIDQNKKVLIFTEFEEQQKLIIPFLKNEFGIVPTVLNGSVPAKNRYSLIENFQNSDKERIFLSTDAGGTGLNLQFMSDIIHFDIPWNPAKVDQRNGRCYRLGQQNTVNIYYLISNRSIEEAIDHILDSKRTMRYSVLDNDSEEEELDNKSIIKIFMKILDGYTPSSNA